MPTPSQVSTPLPLPFGFTLLPSQLPGRQLTPLLYTSLNGLPVYLTLSPSHPPQVSFLPILLALKVPLTPLSLLVKYGLSPTQFSLNIDGIAPWDDLWVNLDVARDLIRDLGAERIFWDDKGRGMLGNVGDAVSWEEGDGWYHNWLPSKSHLPSSSYSLDTLLSTSWSFVEIIPDDRCVFTTCGRERAAKLDSDALFRDISGLRDGAWATAWNSLLGYTTYSWTQYQLSPSKFPITPRTKRRNSKQLSGHPLTDLLQIMPTLFGLAPTSIPLNSTDLLRLTPSSSLHSISQLSILLISALYRQIVSIIPAIDICMPGPLRPARTRTRHTAEHQWQARINLSLCALVSDLIIGIWRLQKENDKLRSILQHRGHHLPAEIVVAPLTDDPGRRSTTRHIRRNETRPANARTTQNRSSTSPSISPSSSEELDVILELEKRRGGSPPPIPPRTPSRSHKARKSHPKSQSGRSQNSTQIMPPTTRRQRGRSRSSGSSSSLSVEPERGVRSQSTAKRPSRTVTTPSSVSSSEKKIPDDIYHEHATGEDDHNDDDEHGEEGVQHSETLDLDHRFEQTRTRTEDGSKDLPDDVPPRSMEVSHKDHRENDDELKVDPIDSLSDQEVDEVDELLSAGQETEDQVQASDDVSPAEVIVDILTPVKPRRIHPWPSLVLTLVAIAAAYFVLHQSGPRYPFL